MDKKKLVSVIVPSYNEEKNITECYKQLKKITDTLIKKYDFEFVFTDNASTDNTLKLLRKIAHTDPRVRVLKFSRNFGYQKAIMTGYSHARGEAALEYDADMQDPVELIPVFIDQWEQGNKIVYGIRKKREESRFIIALRKLYYRILNKISDNDIPVDTGDFLLIDRVIIELLKMGDDRNPYIRGQIFSFGFSRKGIEYNRKKRKHGNTKFNLLSLMRLSWDGIVSQSTTPLRFASVFGIIAAFCAIVLIIYFIISKFTTHQLPLGMTLLTVLVLCSISLNSLFLGIIGEYIARISLQVKSGPNTIIEENIGVSIEAKDKKN